MPVKIKEVQQPRGLYRALYRLPNTLYRVHLGWLAGNRFLELTHIGRKSGLPRHTVLEVLQYDKARDTYFVLAAWGEKSDWLRNIEKTPQVVIHVGHRQFHARIKRLSPEEAELKVLNYTNRHPLARRVLPRLLGYRIDGTEADFRALARQGIVVAFQPLSPQQRPLWENPGKCSFRWRYKSMSPRPDVSEERKNQILEAAMAVFARRGFDEARMDDIAQEAGLSKGALYLYYKSKDAIIGAILKLFFTQAMKKLQGFLDNESQKSAREILSLLNQYYISEMKWMTSLMPITFEFYAVAARQKDVRQFLRQYFKEYIHVLAAIIQRGIDRGELRPVNAETVAISIAALYEGMALLWMVDPHATHWEKTGEDSLLLLLDGLEAKA